MLIDPSNLSFNSELDKVRLDEENYSATNLGYDPVGDDFWLYYSPMLLVDGPVCA